MHKYRGAELFAFYECNYESMGSVPAYDSDCHCVCVSVCEWACVSLNAFDINFKQIANKLELSWRRHCQPRAPSLFSEPHKLFKICKFAVAP